MITEEMVKMLTSSFDSLVVLRGQKLGSVSDVVAMVKISALGLDPEGPPIAGVRMTGKPINPTLSQVGGPEKLNPYKQIRAISGSSGCLAQATENPI